jgi:hypothetical protein
MRPMPLFLAIAVGLACSNSSPRSPVVPSEATPPVSPPPPLPPGQVLVSGTVFEHTSGGARPLAGLRFRVITSSGSWDVEDHVELVSGPDGGYAVEATAGRSVTMAVMPDTKWFAPCPAGFDVLAAPANLNFHVVSADVLLTTGLPASLPLTTIQVSGTVIEEGDTGPRPVAGALVWLAATTQVFWSNMSIMSDVRGRYAVCTSPPGTGTDALAYIGAGKQGYRVTHQEVLLGFPQELDVELIRD